MKRQRERERDLGMRCLTHRTTGYWKRHRHRAHTHTHSSCLDSGPKQEDRDMPGFRISLLVFFCQDGSDQLMKQQSCCCCIFLCIMLTSIVCVACRACNSPGTLFLLWNSHIQRLQKNSSKRPWQLTTSHETYSADLLAELDTIIRCSYHERKHERKVKK